MLKAYTHIVVTRKKYPEAIENIPLKNIYTIPDCILTKYKPSIIQRENRSAIHAQLQSD